MKTALVVGAGDPIGAAIAQRFAAGGRDPESLPVDALMNPASMPEAYWQLHLQPPDAWTFELDLRPITETW